MSKPAQGVVAGVVYGLVMVAFTTVFMGGGVSSFHATFFLNPWVLGAFLRGVVVGVVIGCVQLPWSGWAIGLVFGMLLASPDAVSTKTFGINLVIGAVAGILIGGIIHGWKSPLPFQS